MKHPIFDALADLERNSGPRTVAVLVAMVEGAEVREGLLTFEGGCRPLGDALQMAPSSVNDQLNRLVAGGFINRFCAGSTSFCVIWPERVGLVLNAEVVTEKLTQSAVALEREHPGLHAEPIRSALRCSSAPTS